MAANVWTAWGPPAKAIDRIPLRFGGTRDHDGLVMELGCEW